MSWKFEDSTKKANLLTPRGSLLDSRYSVEGFIGEGTFGQVVKCLDTKMDRKVAIKVTKGGFYLQEQSLTEIEILRQMQILDHDQCSIVQWHGSFVHNNWMCLSFELLDINLEDYLQEVAYMPLADIRQVLQQLATALVHLEALAIVHGDIKPGNIMVVNRCQQPLKVKLIDFGLACHVADIDQGSMAQSLWYRAPEVILGLSFSQSIDLWSLGMTVVELALGCPLFPGVDEYDILRHIVNTLGGPSIHQLDAGLKSTLFFNLHGTWRLKTPEEFFSMTGLYRKDTQCFHSLHDLELMMYEKGNAERKEMEQFINLFKELVQVNENERITPAELLKHPFLTVENHNDSRHVAVTHKEPTVPQQPSPKTTTLLPVEVVPPSPPEDLPSKLKETAVPVQSEVKVLTKTRKRFRQVRSFVRSIKNACVS
ncbi:homeodomain-interacting protein kinase 2-like isoform X2 [Paralichthys olivaceus]